jgi:undecaprenyl-diphosphatase
MFLRGRRHSNQGIVLNLPSRLDRFNRLDLALCLQFNSLADFPFWCGIFRVISRAGNGMFWYVLMALMVVIEGYAALPTVGRMVLASSLGLAIYKWLKIRTSRPRPCDVYAAVSAVAPVLDRFSFPSGHTLHAVSFALVACSAYPQLALLLYPFAALVAISRPVLGLHYPSDVLAGAAIGFCVSQLVIAI